MKLQKMTDFVINAYDKIEDSLDSELAMYRYAMFLKQPLELWMFIPCDEDGNVLENDNLTAYDKEMYWEEEMKFQQAKERCLFDGFSDYIGFPQYSHYISDGMQAVFYVTKNGSIYNKILGMKTIEDLTNKTPITLTASAQKQLSL